MELRLALTALCFFGVVNSVPVTWDSGSCAQQCSSNSVNFNYLVGKTYVYDYDSYTKLNVKNDNGLDVKITATVDVSVISQCNFALKLRNVRLQGPIDEVQYRTILEQYPMSFSFDDGRVEHVCPAQNDLPWAINVKKAIVSSLQMSMRNFHDSYSTQETDILGNCETNYELVSNNWQGIVIRKQKNIPTCGKRQQAIVSFFPRRFFSEDSTIRNIPIFAENYGCEYTLKSGIIRSTKCIETNRFPLSVYSSGPVVQTTSNIVFVKEVNGLTFQAPMFRWRHNLLYSTAPETPKEDASQTVAILRGMCSEISDEIKSSTPEKFEELVSSLRSLSYESASRIYQSVQRKEWCASKKLEDILNDALIMAASEASIKLISEHYLQKEHSIVKATYVSTMLAFANQPSAGSVKSAVQMLEKPNIHRQILLGVSSLIHNYCSDEKHNCRENTDVARALTILKNRLNKCQSQSPESEDEIIVALKAFRNIGHCGEARNTILECAVQSSNSHPIRIAAIEALGYASTCQEQDTQRLMALLKSDKSAEIRIMAYRALLKCPKEETIRTIIEMLQTEESKQVGSFIVSHMLNTKKSSNPISSQYRDLLMKQTNIPEKRFPQDIRKYSQNYELSHFFRQWGFGGYFRTDVIYEDDAIPTSIRTKVSIPIYEKQLDLVEVGFRQKGLKSSVQSFISKQNFGKDFPEIWRNAVKKMQQFVSGTESQKSRFRRAFGLISRSNRDMEASFFLRIDGKDLCYITWKDIQSLSRQDFKQWMRNVERQWKNMMSNPNTDRAFAMTPIDAKLQLPTSNGLQLNLQMKQTFVLGAKIQDGIVIPSASLKSEASVNFGVKSPKSGYKWVANAYTAPKVQLKLDTSNGRVLLVSMPQDEMVFAQFKTVVKAVEHNGQERALQTNAAIRSMSGCTKSLTKFVGVEMCTKVDIPMKLLDIENVVSAPWNLKWSVKKSDREMKGWEFTFTLPQSNQREVYTYKVGFNTPRSRINREMSAKFQLQSTRDGSKGIQMKLKSPMKSVELSADYKWQAKEMLVKTLVVVDQSKKLNVEIALQQQTVGKKYEVKPRVLVQLNNKEKVNLKGSVSYENGQKSNLQIDIRSSNNNQLIKGSLVKHGSLSSTLKLSVDCSANIADYSMRVFGTVDKTPKTVSNDLRVDYQLSNKKKHNVKITSKFQNLGTSALHKLNSFFEMTSTQYPEKNVHISWNFLSKPNEHCENELVLMYSNQFQDQSRKISLLQVTKMNRAKTTVSSSEHSFNVFIGPWNRDYELQGKTNIENSDTPKIKFEVSGREKKQNKSFKSSFEFMFMSRVPLKVSIDAQLQAGQLNLRYSDKLEENGRNNYNGKFMMQYNKKQVNINYSFKIKSDQNGKVHQFDFDMKLPNSRHSTQHQGLLRMSPKEFELRSKLNHQGSSWEYHSLLSKTGKSKLLVDTPMFTGKVEGNPYAYHGFSKLEFLGKSIPLNHWSDLQVQPNSVTFNTKTNYKGKQVSLNSQLSGAASKIVLDTHPLNAKLDWNSVSSPMSGNFEIRSKNSPAFHKTTVFAGPERVEVKSKTEYNGKKLADIDCAYSRNAKSMFNIVTPHFTGNSEALLYGQQKNVKLEIRGHQNPYLHNSELTFTPKTFEIVSKTQHNNVPILSWNSKFNRNAQSNINVETKNIVANIIADPRPNTKTAVIKVEHRPTQLNHITEVQCDPHKWLITSKSDRRGQNLYTLDSQLSRNAESFLNIHTKPFKGNFEVNPYTTRTAKLSFESNPHSLLHSSDFSWTPKKQFVISSTTSRYGQPLTSINSILSQVDKSHLKLSTKPYDMSFELQPFASSRSAKFIVKGNNNPVSHVSEVTYQPNRQTTITSKTETSTGNVHTLDARVSQYDKSHFKYGTKAMNAVLSVNPHSTIKQLEFAYTKHTGIPVFHSTKLAYEPYKHTTLYSKTDSNNNQILLVDSKISHKEPSHLKIHSQPCEASFEVDPYSYAPNANLMIKGRQWPISHSTKVTYQPKQSVTVISSTEKSGKPYLSVNSLLSHVGQSHLIVDSVPVKTTLKVHPFANTKQLSFELKGHPNQLFHNTEISVVPQSSFTIDSTTKKYNKPLLVFNTHLNRNSESHLQFDNDNYKGKIAINPFATIRTGKLDFSSRNLGFDHHTDASVQSHEITVNSNTRHNGNDLFNVNSLLSRNQRSHLNIVHPHFKSECEWYPYAKSGKVNVYSQRYPFEHNTKWDISQPHQWSLNTNTIYNKEKLLHLDSDINKQQSRVMVDWPYFKSEATYQPIRKSLDVDFLSKKSNRRILCAVSADLPKNTVSLELSLDADKNPNDRVKLTISSDKDRYGSQHQLNINGNFRGNSFECPLKMADDLVNGPHDLQCSIRVSPSNIYQVILRHSIKDGKINCNFKINENGKQALNVQNNGMYEKTSDQLKLSGSLKVQSSSKSFDGFEMGAHYEHQLTYSDNRINADIKAKLPGDKPYSAQFKLNQNSNSISLNAVGETPLYDFQRQEMTLNCNFDDDKGHLQGVLTTGSGKKIEVNGNFKMESNEVSASLRTDSDYESVPRIQIEGSLSNDQQKKALFSAEVNSEKYVSILGTVYYKDVTSFNGEAEFDTKWSPHFSVVSRGNKDSSNTDYEVNVKKDAETLMITKFKGGKKRTGYQYKGSMDVSGSNVALLDMNYDYSSGSMYNAVYNGPYRPMTINYKSTQSNDETKHTAKLCSSSCVQLQWIAQDKSTRSRKDQYLSFSLQNLQSSTEYQIDYKYNHDSRSLLNRMSINWNTAKYGYVVEMNEDRRESNWVAQLIIPQRKIELNGKYEDMGESTRTTVQFLPFAVKDRQNKFEAEFIHRHVLTRSSRQLSSHLKISHSEWGQPILAKVDYQTQDSSARPMELKVLFDCGKGVEKQILIDAQIENNDSPRNKSLSVNIYNGNRRNIDGKMTVHFANLRDKMSAGLNWHWLNRQRQMKKGLHILEIRPNQKSFTISSFAPSHQMSASGKWQTSDYRVNIEANVNVNGELRNAHAFLDLKNNVCGELQWMKEPADLLRKYHVCLNTESDRMLEISSESWNDNDKSVDASIVFDKRGTRTFKLHLHWNPAKWNDFLYTLMNSGKALRFNNEYISELQSEISHKMEWLQSTFSRHYLTPLRTRFSSEFDKLRSEIDEEMRPVWRAMRRAVDNLPNFSEALEPMKKLFESWSSTVAYYTDKVTEKMMKHVTRTLTAMCAGNNDCYSLVYAYERRGFEGLTEETSRLSKQYRRNAHQIAYKLKGNVQRFINSLPSDYMQQINKAINSAYSKVWEWKVTKQISSLFSNAWETGCELFWKATESFWEATDSFFTVLKQNDDLKAIFDAIEEIVRDIQKELRNVNWSNISNLFGEMMQFLLSPKHWLFDTRFTNYNLDAGEVTLVIKAPANWNTLRSKWVKQM